MPCRDDDDINDVATMGGVNLVEESRNILAASAGIVMGLPRSCKDESFLDNSPLASRISAIGVYRHSHLYYFIFLRFCSSPFPVFCIC